jgi:hypothetical protein
LSIAIGKAGQNVRLAGKLTGYELDVEGEKGAAKAKKEEKGEEKAEEKAKPPAKEESESKPVVQKLKKKTELEDSLLKAIEEHGTEDS